MLGRFRDSYGHFRAHTGRGPVAAFLKALKYEVLGHE